MSEVMSAFEKAYNKIKSDIINGNLKVNEQIVETDYSNTLNVSRTPLREALRTLEKEGLVKHVSNRGVFVREFSEEDLKELFDLRKIVEVYINEKAFYNINKKEISGLENLIELQYNAYNENNIEKVIELFDEFHHKMDEISKLHIATNFSQVINSYMHIVRKTNYSNNSNRLLESIKEHELMISFMKNGDFEEYIKCCNTHIQNSYNYFDGNK